MKSIATLLVLIFGLSLAATGFPTGLCSGNPDCPHCSTRGLSLASIHDCCAGTHGVPCDLQKDKNPGTSPYYLPACRNQPRNFGAIIGTLIEPPSLFDDFRSPTRTSPLSAYFTKTPIYLSTLTILC